MKRLLATLALIAAPLTAHAAEDTQDAWDSFGGNLVFDAGGLDVDYVFGANVLTATTSGDGNTLTLGVQLEQGCVITDLDDSGCDTASVVFSPSTGDTLTAAGIIGVVSGTPSATTNVIKYTDANTLTWGSDLTAGGDMADGVITGLTVLPNTHTLRATATQGGPYDATLPFEVVQPGTNGQLRAATADDENRIAIDHSNLRVWHREVDTETPPAVGFTNYQPPNYAGTTAYCPSLPGPHDVNDRCFSTGNRLWYRWGGSSWSTLNANPPNWRGARDDRDDAIAHITGTGQIVWWTGQPQPQLVTSFVPGTTTYRYVWEQEPERKALQQSACPAPSTANAGMVCQVNAAGDAYETATVTTADEFVDGGSFSGTELVLTRALGADIRIPGVPEDGVVESGVGNAGHAHPCPFRGSRRDDPRLRGHRDRVRRQRYAGWRRGEPHRIPEHREPD